MKAEVLYEANTSQVFFTTAARKSRHGSHRMTNLRKKVSVGARLVSPTAAPFAIRATQESPLQTSSWIGAC